ncbi:hypothetical protein II906_10460 [bacterium]|nr:hypothetical protein [bacterium]
MDFNSIKSGFSNYLQSKLSEDEKEKLKASGELDISKYSTEFKEYLTTEMGADASIKDMSISDILKMDLPNKTEVKKPEGENKKDIAGSNPMKLGASDKKTEVNIFDGPSSDEAMKEFLEKENVQAYLDYDLNSEDDMDDRALVDDIVENSDKKNLFDITKVIKQGSLSSVLDRLYGDEKMLKSMQTSNSPLSVGEQVDFKNSVNNDDLTIEDVKKSFQNILKNDIKFPD